MILPVTIGENSANVPYCIDLQQLPHLFLSYCQESQAQAFYSSMVELLTSEDKHASIQFAVAFTKTTVSFDIKNGLLFPYCYVQQDEYCSTVPTRESFLIALSKELQRRWKRHATSKELNKGHGQPFPYMIILLDDVMDMVVSTKKSVGLTFLQLLLMGHQLNMHVVAASIATCRNLLRQLMQLNPVVKEKFHTLFSKHAFPIATPLGAELVLTGDDFVFFKEANAVEYSRFYPIGIPTAPAMESCTI